MNGTAGFDIGGTFVKAGVLDASGTLLVTQQRPTPRDSNPQSLVRLVDELCTDWDVKGTCGVAIAGIVAAKEGKLVRSPNLPHWDGVAWKKEFAIAGREIELLNDANAFVLAEFALGAARGAGSVFGLAIGTGVGGGFVTNGILHEGARGYAGEPGHMILLAGGPRCACGAEGCLEALIGTAAIRERYGQISAESRSGTPKEITALAESGDRNAIEALERTGYFLGLGLAGIANLLDPEVFVIGGGISAAGEWILGPARRTMEKTVLHPAGEAPRVERAALGNNAGWMGAALRAAGHRESSARD